jgi:rSAM/selenodomain-associated transferase 2
MRFGVVIPTFNEAAVVGRALLRLGGVPVVVADGGSEDATATLAAAAGAHVIVTEVSRGARMNAAVAALPTVEALLFLHADTRLPQGWVEAATRILAKPGVALGAFRLRIEGGGPLLRLVASGANFRSRRLALPYGDQALFMRRETFEALGGFSDLPIMEDFDLVRRARRLGRIVIADAEVTTSARRWREKGVLATTLVNQAMLIGWWLGVSPGRLARFYRRRTASRARQRAPWDL